MSEYLTEQEQIELLKSWIKQYSLVVITGILVSALVIFGWRFWQEREARILSHASSIYDELLTARSQHDSALSLTQAQKLYSHYPKTVYGQMAGFILSRYAARHDNFQEAAEYLQKILDHSRISSFRQIARLRLARLYLAENKPQDCLETLEKVDDKSFLGMIDEIRGDAYLAMKDNNKAYHAYQLALSELPNAEVVRPLLRMKYDNLTPLKN